MTLDIEEEKKAFERELPGYKALLNDKRSGRRQSNMFKAWLAARMFSLEITKPTAKVVQCGPKWMAVADANLMPLFSHPSQATVQEWIEQNGYRRSDL